MPTGPVVGANTRVRKAVDCMHTIKSGNPDDYMPQAEPTQIVADIKNADVQLALDRTCFCPSQNVKRPFKPMRFGNVRKEGKNFGRPMLHCKAPMGEGCGAFFFTDVPNKKPTLASLLQGLTTYFGNYHTTTSLKAPEIEAVSALLATMRKHLAIISPNTHVFKNRKEGKVKNTYDNFKAFQQAQ